jgi:hypothetical protein
MRALGWASGVLALAGLAAPAEALDLHVIFGGNGRYYRDPGRIAYDEGYRDGINKGQRDGRKGDHFNFWRHGDYRDADDGYHREFGPRYAYQRAYRRGFEAGYRRSFATYARHGYPPRGYYGRDGYGDDRYRDRGRYDDRDRYRYDDDDRY